jgi:hypothetical protein
MCRCRCLVLCLVRARLLGVIWPVGTGGFYNPTSRWREDWRGSSGEGPSLLCCERASQPGKTRPTPFFSAISGPALTNSRCAASDPVVADAFWLSKTVGLIEHDRLSRIRRSVRCNFWLVPATKSIRVPSVQERHSARQQ